MEKGSIRRWDWLSACLLFLLIQVAAARLVTTNWAPHLYFAELTAAYGTVLGLALGLSEHKRRIIIWFVIDYTLALLPWQMTHAVEDDFPLAGKLLDVGRILITSLDQFILRQPVKDSLFFVAIVSFVFWIISLCAGYWLVRHQNVLAAILPSGIGILFIQVYDNFVPYTSWWLAVFLLVTLLLLGRHYYLLHQDDWKKRRVFVSEESWTNILGSLFTTAALAIVIAWILPTSLSALQSAANSWNRFTKPIRERLSNAVTSLNAPYGPSIGSFYGDTLALGRSINQADTPVFSAKVLSSPNFDTRYYWRGRVYDVYNNGQWTDSPAARVDFGPGSSSLNIPNADGRQEGDFEFTFQLPAQTQLYAPSQPVWINQPGSILVTPVDSNSYDLLSWDANSPVESGGRYEVRSEIADPTIDAMRSASTDYPQWITSRYLEIPENIRPEIQSLAEQVTIGQSNPYDKATAITGYLRANLQYQTTLPAPPSGQDPVLWVLLSYKKAFCTYYASAEVLMLRSIGIPARLAVGYAQGKLQNDTYIVRQLDTHAWPEVYFSGTGWVEFEPTVSQAPLIRPETTAQVSAAGGHPITPPKKLDEGDAANPHPIHGFVGVIRNTSLVSSPWFSISLVLAAALLIFVFYRYRPFHQMPFYLSNMLVRNSMTVPAWIENWQRWNQLEPVERYFASVNLSLGWLGERQPLDVTAAQRSALLRKKMPSASAHIEALNVELESALFTPRPANLSRARRAAFFIILHALRARVSKIWDAINGSDVYSG